MAKLLLAASFALVSWTTLAEAPATMGELREFATKTGVDDREATARVLLQAVRLKSPTQFKNPRGHEFIIAHVVEGGMVRIDAADLPWADPDELAEYVDALNLHISATVGYVETAHDLLEAMETCDCPRIVIPRSRSEFFNDAEPGDMPPSLSPNKVRADGALKSGGGGFVPPAPVGDGRGHPIEANWSEAPTAHLTARETWDAVRTAQLRGVRGDRYTTPSLPHRR